MESRNQFPDGIPVAQPVVPGVAPAPLLREEQHHHEIVVEMSPLSPQAQQYGPALPVDSNNNMDSNAATDANSRNHADMVSETKVQVGIQIGPLPALLRYILGVLLACLLRGFEGV